MSYSSASRLAVPTRARRQRRCQTDLEKVCDGVAPGVSRPWFSVVRRFVVGELGRDGKKKVCGGQIFTRSPCKANDHQEPRGEERRFNRRFQERADHGRTHFANRENSAFFGTSLHGQRERPHHRRPRAPSVLENLEAAQVRKTFAPIGGTDDVTSDVIAFRDGTGASLHEGYAIAFDSEPSDAFYPRDVDLDGKRASRRADDDLWIARSPNAVRHVDGAEVVEELLPIFPDDVFALAPFRPQGAHV